MSLKNVRLPVLDHPRRATTEIGHRDLAELLGPLNGLAVAIARAVTAADVEPYSWAQSRGR
jgi:hypothetical protein